MNFKFLTILLLVASFENSLQQSNSTLPLSLPTSFSLDSLNSLLAPVLSLINNLAQVISSLQLPFQIPQLPLNLTNLQLPTFNSSGNYSTPQYQLPVQNFTNSFNHTSYNHTNSGESNESGSNERNTTRSVPPTVRPVEFVKDPQPLCNPANLKLEMCSKTGTAVALFCKTYCKCQSLRCPTSTVPVYSTKVLGTVVPLQKAADSNCQCVAP